MTFSKREVTRRKAITAAALGTLAAGYPLSLRAAKPTAQEKGNIQAVKDFCEAWPAHDVDKIMSYVAELRLSPARNDGNCQGKRCRGEGD